MIEVRELTKRYGDTVAVRELSFTVKPGQVTGFLGPNGSGKSTTMRAILGLDRPTSGVAMVNGRPYATLRKPLHEVGALLDAGAVHGGRTAEMHLRCVARSNGIGRARVTDVLERVGLAGVARKRIGGFSLGMRQRLGIGAALLGDPGVLMFDEPVNGLDPEGIRWIRELMRALAAEGRTVLVSSHLMSEMALTADHVVVIGRGQLITETSMAALSEDFRRDVLVRTPRADELRGALSTAGASVHSGPDGELAVRGMDAVAIGDLALRAGIAVHELTPRSASLEEAYMELTDESVEYRAQAGRAS
ncbi:ABC-2 type transport system ATP-binding protein [Herbihabitans rhizosphaerae]|uniref:ABC-2 type transport system ATP-binding protein n=1 Tax=Herbihabitans rhizosphaerae TaxID=1872711 RepID=A0A4Q7KK38_9PSEU|nr:ATP-binding cassette domain-containing protein [Herbihabitans rhizosphaerae]RZS36574.1 ABC-2 type transport system ATP-binding protein [Herbihabitans rhizosphaerae]